jgi:hypothetical protein
MEWPGTLAVAHSYLKHRAGELMRYCIKKVSNSILCISSKEIGKNGLMQQIHVTSKPACRLKAK